MNWSIALSPQNTNYLLGGASIAFSVTFSALAVSLSLGLLVGLARLSRRRVISGVAGLYIEIFRNAPVLVILFWVFYALPPLLGTYLPPVLAAAIALGVNGAGYMAENYRTAIQSVDKRQAEAGRALGMSAGSVFRKIIMPQALRTLTPLVMNHFSGLLKWSSLVSAIGVMDLTYRANYLVSYVTAKPVEIYTAIAAFYVVVAGAAAAVARILEVRWARRY